MRRAVFAIVIVLAGLLAAGCTQPSGGASVTSGGPAAPAISAPAAPASAEPVKPGY